MEKLGVLVFILFVRRWLVWDIENISEDIQKQFREKEEEEEEDDNEEKGDRKIGKQVFMGE